MWVWCEYYFQCLWSNPFVGDLEQDEDEEPIDLRSNSSQEGGDDGTPLAKGSRTRSMAKQIQEELATSS